MTRGQASSIELQERDIALLCGLFESRVMTASHITVLYFDGKAEATKKRLQKLKAAGYIGERSRRKVYDPAVLFLTRQAFQYLHREGLLTGYPLAHWESLKKRVQVSDLTLRHELAVMDVKAALSSAIAKTKRFSVAQFSTWPLLYQFKAFQPDGKAIVLKPDGFIRIGEKAERNEEFEHTFFLEVDRSTETLDTLARKAHCYRDFYTRGGMAERQGRPRSEFKEHPFRVLMVFRTAERRNNMAEQLLLATPPMRTFVWLTTLEEMTQNPLGPIWLTPAAYEAAVHGTPYAPTNQRFRTVYQRQMERERVVEERAEKVGVVGKTS